MQALRPSLSFLCVSLLAALLLTGCSDAQKRTRALDRADRLYAEEEFEKAKVEYLNVLRLDPKNAKANERLGLIWLEQGSPLRAGSYLATARESAPNDYDLRTKLARVMLSLGKADQARSDALHILSRAPNQGDALVILAESVRTRDDYKLAETELAKAADKQSAAFHRASATMQLLVADRKKAMHSLLRALNNEPNSPAVLTALAGLHLRSGELPEAEKYFKSAVAAAPARSTAHIAYAEFLLQNGKPKEGIQVLEDMTRRVPDYLPAWLALAQHAYSQKDYARTTQLLQQVITKDQGNYDAHMIQALVINAKGDSQKAAAAFEKLGAAFPGMAPAHYQLALLHLQAKQVAEAKEALKKTVAVQPDHDQAILLLAELNLQANEPEPVIEAMVPLLVRRSNLARAQWLLTAALQAQGRFDGEIGVLQEKIRANPNSGPMHFVLGQTQARQGDLEGAKNSFQQALKLIPGFFPAAFSLVDIQLHTGQAAAARELAETMLREFPSSPDAHFLLGRIHAAQREWPQAEDLLRKTIEINGTYTPAYSLLLYCLVTTNRLQQAVSELEALRAKTPDNLHLLMLSGVIYQQMERLPEARSAYEAYLNLKPDGSLALNNLALIYAEDPSLLDRAVEMARKAHEVDPNSASIADSLGWIHFKRKEYGAAVELLRQAITGLPNRPEIQFHYAMASMMNGDHKTAREFFEKAAAAKSDFKGKDQIAGHLAKLPREP